jgi:hypothetical protein
MVRHIKQGVNTQKPPDYHGGVVYGLAREPLLRLDGEGVFQALHALLQVLNLPLLLGQEQVFDPI